MQFTVFDQGVTRSGLRFTASMSMPCWGVSQTGAVGARLEANYDVLLSQKLFVQPFVEAMLVSQEDPAIQLGSGLARYEVGLRRRYQIVKEFAPFIGVSFAQFTGHTASLVAAERKADSNLRALLGLKVWS